MGVDLILFHIKELGAAGYEHGQHILLGAAGDGCSVRLAAAASPGLERISTEGEDDG